MRILSVVGTRPEAVKMAMVARTLAGADGVEHELCVTAQHREMLDSVLRLFELTPDYDLNVMTPGQDLTGVTGAVLSGMREVLAEAKPDRVLVQGDTTTVLATALAAFYARIPVGHVEAGLRTGDMSAPWPEEMNRRLADALSDRHYAPTETARRRLLDEGLPDAGIVVTGNTVIDALLHVVDRLTGDPELVRGGWYKAAASGAGEKAHSRHGTPEGELRRRVRGDLQGHRSDQQARRRGDRLSGASESQSP